MSADYTLPVRRAVLPALKADVGVTGLIPAASIYPSTVPATRTFPFIRYGAPITTPFLASGLDSSSTRITIHAFTKPKLDATGAVTDTAEDQAHAMAFAIAGCLGAAILALDDGMKVRLTWTGSLITQDGDEADAWHAAVSFTAEVAG